MAAGWPIDLLPLCPKSDCLVVADHVDRRQIIGILVKPRKKGQVMVKISPEQATLPVRLVDKPWGKWKLPAPFVSVEERQIGEIWFEPPASVPQLLVKYIFTSEKLSVQVHPSDKQTFAFGLGKQGKEECWLVMAAEPGAQLGIGFRDSISLEQMRAAALDGSIEQLMAWHDVVAGDFFYIPANTVHAIGAGVTVLEVQQNSDITYRLYDYGRPRELHLDVGVSISLGSVYNLDCWHKRLPDAGTVRLVDGPYFRMDRVSGAPDSAWAQTYGDRPLLVAPLAEEVTIENTPIAPGNCGLARTINAICFADEGSTLLIQPIDLGDHQAAAPTKLQT